MLPTSTPLPCHRKLSGNLRQPGAHEGLVHDGFQEGRDSHGSRPNQSTGGHPNRFARASTCPPSRQGEGSWKTIVLVKGNLPVRFRADWREGTHRCPSWFALKHRAPGFWGLCHPFPRDTHVFFFNWPPMKENQVRDSEAYLDVEPLEDRLVLFSSQWLEHEARQRGIRLELLEAVG